MSSKTWKGIAAIIGIVLGPMLRAITPIIKDAMEDSLLNLYSKAEETENPIDDIFVGLLLDLLSIKRP